MRTILISPMWLDSSAEDSMKRHTRWLDFILPLKDKLGYDKILFIDNASNPDKVKSLEDAYPMITIARHTKHLSRKTHLRYPYWYNALATGAMYALQRNYEKIIYIDTDFFPLTDKMCDYTKNTNTGWTGLYCHKHNFPETCYQIVGKDKLQDFFTFHFRDFLSFYPDLDAESQTPFTHVEKGFKGDRYGEQNVAQTPEMDYYGQARPEQELVFNMAAKKNE